MRTRTGTIVRVDASGALRQERSGDLVVGEPFNVRGKYDAARVSARGRDRAGKALGIDLAPRPLAISADELQRRLESGAAPFMLDVREREEMADGRSPARSNIPMREVGNRLSDLPPTDRDIVVICHLGGRSELVTRRLNALGYERAINLEGGMEAWLARSLG